MEQYRNTVDVISTEGVHVDAHSLWNLKDGILVLVDDDQYAAHALTDDFYKI